MATTPPPTQPPPRQNIFRIVLGVYLVIAMLAWYFLANEDPPTTSWWKRNFGNPGVRVGKALIWPYSLFRQSSAERHLSNFKAYTLAAMEMIQDKLEGKTQEVDWDSCTRFLQIAGGEGQAIPDAYLKTLDDGANIKSTVELVNHLNNLLQQGNTPAQHQAVIDILTGVRGQK